jgi:signal transduction histidine kinase
MAERPGTLEALAERVRTLERDLRTAEEFLSFAMHELKTPITSLEGYAYLLKQEKNGPDSRRRCAEGIARNAARLTALVQELLDIGRVRTGRLALARHRLDLAAAARAAAEAARPDLAETLRLDVRADPGTPVPVVGDEARLAALVRAMIVDAADRAGEGGAVVVEVAARNGEAVVAARDTGRPIQAESLEAGFRGLRRTGGAWCERAGGGLGLALGGDVVRALGGRTFAAPLAEGNEIGFALPLAASSGA